MMFITMNIESEKQLDRIYHAIPEWVHRSFPNEPLDVKIIKALGEIQEMWTSSYLREVQDHAKAMEFSAWLCKTHGVDFSDNYWKFLISRPPSKNSKYENKKVLTPNAKVV